MTYIVTERCVANRYTDCVADCPVDCFYEIQDPHMLIINPDECIDCDACVSLCPVNAIYPDGELPDEFEEWTDKNDVDLCTDDNRITETLGALDGSKPIEDVKQAEEGKYGAVVADPSSAAH